ncbi:PDZ domain-containing protein [Flagellimonas sp. S3867]|uniref:PDZ domain-containing protein n=1 Tax=Flagellimonas sp. S3867 TaxID=2768063 RepID=UPI001688589A|nr:PDZ domain-containing protein [Flagellimonas sp. S3867]
MLKKKHFVLLFILFLGFSAEVIAQKAKYFNYSEIRDPKADDNLIPLEKGNNPQVITWQTVEQYTQIIEDLKQKGYTIVGMYLGHPSFKTSLNKKRAIAAAKKAKATIIVSNGFISSTCYAMQKVKPKPIVNVAPAATGQVSGKIKLGVSLRDLTLEERTDIERNKGAFVVDVIEDTPAFESNIIPGDVLIKIHGLQVKDANQAILLINAIDTNEDLKVTVFRKGGLRELVVKFN